MSESKQRKKARQEDHTPEEWARILRRRERANRRNNDPERKEARKEYMRAYRANPETKAISDRWFAENTRSRFGFSPADVKRTLGVQNNRCGCCGIPFSAEVTQHRDHCHDSGKPRGLLCARCNWTEGCTRATNKRLAVLGLPLLEHSPQMQAYLDDPPAQRAVFSPFHDCRKSHPEG